MSKKDRFDLEQEIMECWNVGITSSLCRQFEILLLGLASKLGLHPVAIAHLSPGNSSLVVS